MVHQSREKETFDSVGVWCIPFVSNTQVEGWFDSNGVVAHVSLVFWLTKPRPPWAETGRSGEGRACIIDYSPLRWRRSFEQYEMRFSVQPLLWNAFICGSSSIGRTPSLRVGCLRVRVSSTAPARKRHFPCVAQRLADGSLICASRQTMTKGFLMKGLEFSLHTQSLC